jgi:mRNA-degrading endonuclease toxin of MazEF toxin-antitoxin module
VKRGGIYLVDFGERYQSNIGKRCPAVLLSAQSYLDIVSELRFPSVLVLPLTTQCTGNPGNLLRVQVLARERLERSSEIIVNWSCSVDLKDIDVSEGPLTRLTRSEMQELEEKFTLYCGL